MTRQYPLRAPPPPSPTLAEVSADFEPHSPVRPDEHEGDLVIDPIPYVDYVRIEVRANGKTRVIEFETPEWDRQDRPQVWIKPADVPTEVIVFGGPSPVRRPDPLPDPVKMTFEVTGPQAVLTFRENDE